MKERTWLDMLINKNPKVTKPMKAVKKEYRIPAVLDGLNTPLAPFFPKKNEESKSVFRRKRIWVRQGGCCAYCDTPITFEETTVDHIVPKSKGGTKNLKNIVVVCARCNFLKGDIGSVAEANERVFVFTEFIARLSEKGYLK